MAQSDGQAQTQGALNRMILREEVLQICYWYQGEGFGDLYAPDTLQPFLNNNRAAIQAALRSLQEGGYLEAASEAISAYRFTEKGRKEGGRLFAGEFSDYQRTGHGECAAGCCDDEDHSECGDDCTLH